MELNWTRCDSYDDAMHHDGVIYVHEWQDSLLYIGIANYWFGGNRRRLNGQTRSARYASSYRHWIDACLRHGGRLYIGLPDNEAVANLEDIERTMILRFDPELNRRRKDPETEIHPDHAGEVPPTISQALD